MIVAGLVLAVWRIFVIYNGEPAVKSPIWSCMRVPNCWWRDMPGRGHPRGLFGAACFAFRSGRPGRHLVWLLVAERELVPTGRERRVDSSASTLRSASSTRHRSRVPS